MIEPLRGVSRVRAAGRLDAAWQDQPTPADRVEQVTELRRHSKAHDSRTDNPSDPKPSIVEIERRRTPDDSPPGPSRAEVDAAYRAALLQGKFEPSRLVL